MEVRHFGQAFAVDHFLKMRRHSVGSHIDHDLPDFRRRGVMGALMHAMCRVAKSFPGVDGTTGTFPRKPQRLLLEPWLEA